MITRAEVEKLGVMHAVEPISAVTCLAVAGPQGARPLSWALRQAQRE